jgi:signal transduction histidine kinase
MTPKQLSRIGERFYRADDSGATPGTGLGMSLVKEIVSIYAGEVEFTSDNEKGIVVPCGYPLLKINNLRNEL